MKNLMDDKLGKNNSSYGKEVESYIIEAKHKVRTSKHVSREVMVKGAQTIIRLIRWDNPIDPNTIWAYLMSEYEKKNPIMLP